MNRTVTIGSFCFDMRLLMMIIDYDFFSITTLRSINIKDTYWINHSRFHYTKRVVSQKAFPIFKCDTDAHVAMHLLKSEPSQFVRKRITNGISKLIHPREYAHHRIADNFRSCSRRSSMTKSPRNCANHSQNPTLPILMISTHEFMLSASEFLLSISASRAFRASFSARSSRSSPSSSA
jgi:hypothetical protein